MSRYEYHLFNTTIAVGYDHLLGTFFQYFHQDHEEGALAVVNINNQGVSIDEEAEPLLTPEQIAHLQVLQQRFDQSSIDRPNLSMDDYHALVDVFNHTSQWSQIYSDMA